MMSDRELSDWAEMRLREQMPPKWFWWWGPSCAFALRRAHNDMRPAGRQWEILNEILDGSGPTLRIATYSELLSLAHTTWSGTTMSCGFPGVAYYAFLATIEIPGVVEGEWSINPNLLATVLGAGEQGDVWHLYRSRTEALVLRRDDDTRVALVMPANAASGTPLHEVRTR